MTRPNITRSTWIVEYDNDTGPDDDSFWQWWNVTDGTTSYRASTEDEANSLCQTLNSQADLLEALEGLTSFVETYHNTTDASGYIDAARTALLKAGYTF